MKKVSYQQTHEFEKTQKNYENCDLKDIYNLYNQWTVGYKGSLEISAAITPEVLNKNELLVKPDQYGTTLLHILANIGDLGRVPEQLLTKAAIMTSDFSGQTVAAAAAASGHFDSIPKDLLDHEVLTSPRILPLCHKLADSKELHKIPQDLLTMEIVLSVDNKGSNIAHRLIRRGLKESLTQIPAHLLTDEVFLSKDRSNKTPLDYIAENGNFQEIPKKYLKEEILFPNGGKYHCLLDSIIKGSIAHKNFEFYKHILKKLTDQTIKTLIKTQKGTDILELAQKENAKRKIKNLAKSEDFSL